MIVIYQQEHHINILGVNTYLHHAMHGHEHNDIYVYCVCPKEKRETLKAKLHNAHIIEEDG